MRFCTNCGTPVSGQQRYCTHCGTPIGQPAASPATAREASSPAGAGREAPGPPATPSPPGPALSAETRWLPGFTGTGEARPAGPMPAGPGPGEHMPAGPGPGAHMPAGPGPGGPVRDGPGPDGPVPAEPAWPEPGPPPWPAPGHRLRTIALIALAVLVAAGAVAWLASGSQPQHGQSAPGRSTAGRAARGRPAQARTALAHRPSPARSGAPSPRPSHSATARPAGPAAPAGQPASHGIVSISPRLARRANVQPVAALLGRYFAAVNQHDYRGYFALFVGHQLTAAQFTDGYRTTRDSSAVLVGLTARRGSALAATVTFQSHQDPAASPEHAGCLNWRITLYLRRIVTSYRIGLPPAGYQASFRACG